MCLENHWGHGAEKKAGEIYWGSYESSNQLWGLALSSLHCKEQK